MPATFTSDDFAFEMEALDAFFNEMDLSKLERYALMQMMCSYIRTDLKISDDRITNIEDEMKEYDS